MLLAPIVIIVLPSLQEIIDGSDERQKKLFVKQKRFMELNPNHNSLGRTKLKNVCDKYGRELWEIRLNQKDRIVFIEKEQSQVVWLKLCTHDELSRRNTIFVDDTY